MKFQNWKKKMFDNYFETMPIFGSGIECTIPTHKYCDLCNCIYCWNYSKMKACDDCEKLYCSDHIKHHPCFKENSTMTPTISIGAAAYVIPTEVPLILREG